MTYRPSRWTVSRLTRAVRLQDAATVWLLPGDTLTDLHHEGGQCYALYQSKWLVIPPNSWSALIPVPPKRSA
jgi:hypothetical protein